MKIKLLAAIASVGFLFFGTAVPVFAAENELTSFTTQTLQTIITLASLAATFFLVKGGYDYITSSGKPDNLEGAKKTIRNALIGLTLVIGAGVVSSLLNNAFTTAANPGAASQIALTPLVPVKPADGLTQVLLDAITGFLQNIVQSATKPLVDGIISMLTTTPSILTNSVIFNFWLAIVGIADTLFVLVIAVLGLQVMSASTFGFEELDIKQILPRIGLAFLGANTSIFLVDWIVLLCNTMIKTLLAITGGLDHAWVVNAIDPMKFISGETTLVTLIFMLLFIILAVVLLLFYITRLIMISFGAAIAPLIFLLWAIPKTADFAEMAVKTFFVTVFTAFVHVVVIQLASAFFALPDQTGPNPIMAILIGVGLLFTLLRIPTLLFQLAFYVAAAGTVKKIGGQVMNVMTHPKDKMVIEGLSSGGRTVKTPRRVVAA